jgi:hypothetical protein
MDVKPIPLNTGEKAIAIPPASNSILARGVRGLEQIVPEFHHSFLRSMGVREGEQNPAHPVLPAQSKIENRQESFERGDVVVDIVKNMRVTVIKCAVGRTKRGTPIHRVVSKSTGDSWKVAENKLKKG